ncbi:unnamed protein product [Arctogadus glacialis]
MRNLASAYFWCEVTEQQKQETQKTFSFVREARRSKQRGSNWCAHRRDSLKGEFTGWKVSQGEPRRGGNQWRRLHHVSPKSLHMARFPLKRLLMGMGFLSDRASQPEMRSMVEVID